MLCYSILFLTLSIVAGILGFNVIEGTAATIAKVCFFFFLVLFLASFLRRTRTQ